MHRALLLTQGRRIRGLWLVLLVAAGTSHAQGGQPPSQVLSQSLPDMVPLLDGVTDKSGPELRNDSNTPLTTAQSQELQQLKEIANSGQPNETHNVVAARAAWVLGLMYLHGTGVRTDVVQAHQWFERAYDKGERMASAGLAWCALQGCISTPNVPAAKKWIAVLRTVDPARARYLEWLSKTRLAPIPVLSLDPGSPQAGMLAHRHLLVSAARGGDVHAQIELGLESAAINRFDKALQYFQEAAPRSVVASDNVVIVKEHLTIQKAKSGAEIKPPAPGHNAEALFKEARRYHRGEGIPVNYNEAIRLYRMAQSAGSVQAQRMLNLIYARTSADGQLDMGWMRQLSDADVSGPTPQMGHSTGPRLLHREPTPLYDLLPKLWKSKH
jgi:TPR repeat protein